MNEKLWTSREAKNGTPDDLKSAMVIPPMGLNENLAFMGKELHVQTENKGWPTPCILTQVFLNGRVVLSEKSEIPQDLDEKRGCGAIQNMMHAQHSQVIQKIKDKQAKAQGKS
jgi:hypothetical protein